MAMGVRIGLIGDRNPTVPAHQAIPLGLEEAGQALDVAVDHEWIPTTQIAGSARLAGFTGLWCVPASPYRSMEGALRAIRHAREQGLAFLGTCGGFQHALIEFARNALQWQDAEHAETAPHAQRAVITPLSCGLIDGAGWIRLVPGTRLAQAYGAERIQEEYRCRYGLNPLFRAALLSAGLREAACDELGDLRAVELGSHPFFVATLFQPERAALRAGPTPLVQAFVRACAQGRRAQS